MADRDDTPDLPQDARRRAQTWRTLLRTIERVSLPISALAVLAGTAQSMFEVGPAFRSPLANHLTVLVASILLARGFVRLLGRRRRLVVWLPLLLVWIPLAAVAGCSGLGTVLSVQTGWAFHQEITPPLRIGDWEAVAYRVDLASHLAETLISVQVRHPLLPGLDWYQSVRRGLRGETVSLSAQPGQVLSISLSGQHASLEPILVPLR